MLERQMLCRETQYAECYLCKDMKETKGPWVGQGRKFQVKKIPVAKAPRLVGVCNRH